MVDTLHSLFINKFSIANVGCRCWSATSHLIGGIGVRTAIHHFLSIKSIEFHINWLTCEQPLRIDSQLGGSVTFEGWSTFTCGAYTRHSTLIWHIRESCSIHINSKCTGCLIHPWSRSIFFRGIKNFAILSLEFVPSIRSFAAVNKSGGLVHELNLWIVILRPRDMFLWDPRCDSCFRVYIPLDNTASSLWLQSWVIRTRSWTIINLEDYWKWKY